jgi:heme exporter protein A
VSSAVLELHALACLRGRRQLFAHLSHLLRAGELLRVVGPNGAGKTSLLRMICGLLAPAGGRVLWRGKPIAAQREEYHRELCYLGHAAALKDDLTALENLQLAARLGGSRVDESSARRALADAGLAGREHLPARMLSAGQRRRAALARLPLADATLWVLDEPFNALDTAATTWLAGLVEAHLQRGGLAVLTSHQPVALGAQVAQVELAL